MSSHSHQTTILAVAAPCPIPESLDYLAPKNHQGQLYPGQRVLIPLGKRQVIGVITQVKQQTTIEIKKLKAVLDVIDSTPLLPKPLLNCLIWSASYYCQPIGEVISTALPTLLKKDTHAKKSFTTYWSALPNTSIQAIPNKAKRQQELFKLIEKNQQGIEDKAIRQAGFTKSQLDALQDKGFITSQQKSWLPETRLNNSSKPLALNSEQKQALGLIKKSLNHYQTSLIEGVTGSGKTEVYLQATEAVLNEGKQVLVLVPEIGLTPQIIQRFKKRFLVPIVVLHSNMTDQERLNSYLCAKDNEAQIVIGTRSSVFTPFKKLGLIIVDEEHDLSYKQQEGFRYSARDIAIRRAYSEQIPIILGSATPSLESLRNALEGRYQHIPLTQKAQHQHTLEYKINDIQHQPLHHGFSEESLQAIKTTVEAGQQALVFINRRGFAPTLFCEDCRWIAQCTACDSRLTVHNQPSCLRCHHCDFQSPVPHQCPLCHSKKLAKLGTGTERSEEALTEYFPNTKVLRIDRDSMQKKAAFTSAIAQVLAGEPTIISGTQMIAKGHHFPKVTLAVILDADSGFFSADFRGSERIGQLLTQVAGRAGREQAGKVIIQTHYPDHPLLTELLQKGYGVFARQLLIQRQVSGLPPYSHGALIKAQSIYLSEAESLLNKIKQQTSHLLEKDDVLIGPLPALMPKRNNRFRFQLLLHSPSRKRRHHIVNTMRFLLSNSKEARKVRWAIDVDPQDMS